MTRPKDGKKDARIQNRDEAANKEYFIDLQSYAKAISILLMVGLTIFLAWRDQYFYSLCGACLTLAAATSDRLKKIRIGLQGLHSEWSLNRIYSRRPMPKDRHPEAKCNRCR